MIMFDPKTRRLELETFMHFAFGIWPQIREEHISAMRSRCKQCILSEAACALEPDGVCLECLAYQAGSTASSDPLETSKANEELHELLQSRSGSAEGLYDAVVLYSGGKDSMYLMHRLQSDYSELRVLALLVDNGLMSEVAIDNAYFGAKKLGIELLRFTPEPDLFRKTFRHAFLHLNTGGCYTTVDRMDGDLVFDIGRNIAARFGAPLLLAGLSTEQIELIMGFESFESPPEAEKKGRSHSGGFAIDSLYSTEERQKYWWAGATSGRSIPRVVFPFYAWRPAEKNIVSFVKDKNLIKPGQDNPLITNNHTIPVMLAVDYAALGYSSFEPEFAKSIREGKSNREAWLSLFEAVEFLSRQGKFLPYCVSETLEYLDLAERDVGVAPLDKNANIIGEYSCVKSA